MVEEGDLDDRLEDKATNEVVNDVKKVAMEGVDKEKKQVAMIKSYIHDTTKLQKARTQTLFSENC